MHLLARKLSGFKSLGPQYDYGTWDILAVVVFCF